MANLMSGSILLSYPLICSSSDILNWKWFSCSIRCFTPSYWNKFVQKNQPNILLFSDFCSFLIQKLPLMLTYLASWWWNYIPTRSLYSWTTKDYTPTSIKVYQNMFHQSIIYWLTSSSWTEIYYTYFNLQLVRRHIIASVQSKDTAADVGGVWHASLLELASQEAFRDGGRLASIQALEGFIKPISVNNERGYQVLFLEYI